MVDVVYPWTPSEFFELRYSINSVKRNFVDLGTIFVLSDVNPEIEGVRWVDTEEEGKSTDERINKKIMRACLLEGISDPFIYCCDDFYFLQKTTFDEIDSPVALEWLNPDKPYKGAHRWRLRLWNTIYRLDDMGVTTYNYATHTPWVVRKDDFLEAVQFYGSLEGQIESMYFNITHNSDPSGFLKETDLRAGYYSDMAPTFQAALLAGKRFMSHNDQGLNDSLKRIIRLLFTKI